MSIEKLHFSDLNEYHKFIGIVPPEHPLFSVVSSQAGSKDEVLACPDQEIAISSDFYSISLKHIVSGEIFYGRTKYDCQNGTMLFMAPQQEIRLQGVKVVATGRTIVFHEDFIRGFSIKSEIDKYSYFSYAVNEALHLSPKEEQMIAGLFDQIEQEYTNNHDAFSKELILSQLDTLLKYANRFYHRQFLHRKESNSLVRDAFIEILERDFMVADKDYKTIPTIEQMADIMGMTPRYLSDALKVETGKTAIENLHIYLVDKAKDLLLQSDATVASVAYELGFEYPQYFARLFKKKVGLTPTEYREKLH